MTAIKTRLADILVLIFIMYSVLPLSVRGAKYQVINATISEAEQAIAVGFEAALEAEKAGANISSLLIKLNEGAEYLSAARTALGDGNHSEAERLSGLSIEVSAQVESDAQILETEAINAAINRFRLYMASSAVAMVTVVFATLWGYRLLKKWYLKRLLEMEPEVKEV